MKTQTITITPRSRKFAFAYGPATTDGIDLCSTTPADTLQAVEPMRGFENVLTYDGRKVVGVDGRRFAFLTNAAQNLAAVREALQLGQELGKPTTIQVEDDRPARLILTLDPDLRTDLERLSERTGASLAELMRRAAREYLDRQR